MLEYRIEYEDTWGVLNVLPMYFNMASAILTSLCWLSRYLCNNFWRILRIAPDYRKEKRTNRQNKTGLLWCAVEVRIWTRNILKTKEPKQTEEALNVSVHGIWDCRLYGSIDIWHFFHFCVCLSLLYLMMTFGCICKRYRFHWDPVMLKWI